MSTYLQADRPLTLTTPLGENKLLLTGFSGSEGISQLFSYQLEMVSEEGNIAAKDIVGKGVTAHVRRQDGSLRHFHGLVSRFAYSGADDRLHSYRAEVVPWLWFLSRTTDCRIFQEKSIPDIIEQIFKDLGFSEFKLDLKGKHKPHEYCVQYRETDLEFVSRLMEEEGIFYFFKQDDGKHSLVLGDHAGAYYDAKEKNVSYMSPGIAEMADEIKSWQHEYEYRSGKWAQTDYNFETPSTSLMAKTNSLVKLDGNSKFEFYDFPGRYANAGDGNGLVKLRMEEEEAGYDVVLATSICANFSPGGKFTVQKHYLAHEEGQTYVVTTVQHTARLGGGYETGVQESEVIYQNSFTCIPEAVTFRPPLRTRIPYVHGSQTAVVVGPPGEEIYPDKYGRVKVQFHWDREGKKDDKSSCWVRVSTPSSGKGWGSVHIPRIGQEVVVSYLEGDPDQPLITGMVYNNETMPPYGLPANKTQSGFKTRSSPGGGEADFNEIRFEDKKGKEELYFHAQKDQKIHVENDRSELVQRDRHLQVDRDKTEKVKRDKSIDIMGVHNEVVAKDMTVNVGQNLTETVLLNYAETVGAAMQITVGGLMAISVGAAMSEAVGGQKNETVGLAKSETIGGDRSLTVGKDVNQTIGGNQTVKVLKDFTENVTGKHTHGVTKEYTLKAKKVQLVADDEITFKTGSAEIVMKKNGDITIKGNKITVKGSGDVVVKGSKISNN